VLEFWTHQVASLNASAGSDIATDVTSAWSVRLSHSCTLLKPMDAMKRRLAGKVI